MQINKGSHVSYSFLKPVNAKYRFFNFRYRCQSKDILEQYDSGVRLFDLRIRFGVKQDPIVCYGPVEYNISWAEVLFNLQDLNELSTKEDKVYIVVTLEQQKDDGSSRRYQEKRFISTCKELENNFPEIGFFGGKRRYDWKEVYKFEKQAKLYIYPAFASSVCSPGSLGRMWPWYYSRTKKKQVLEDFMLSYSDNFKWFMTDYV